ncbi:ABC transporter permease [Georgenia sp. SYP-B2076]|uniref:ABC transporter permease n=1 Tax=Georgenia sp. SYP-B2076 TaxID=2495881 RepID=UPI000F8D23F3|nr:ABC transporter permease [Georgenia sp. SYP-B2076]
MTTTTTPPDHRVESPSERPDDAPRVKHPWLVVTVREIVVKLTNRSFMLSTGLTLVMIVAGAGVGAFVGGRTTDFTVAVTSAEGRAAVDAGRSAIESGDSGDTLAAEEYPDEAAARAAVGEEEVDAALIAGPDGWTVIGNDGVNRALAGALSDGVGAAVLEANAEAAGTTVAQLTAGTEITTELLVGEDRSGLAEAVGFVFAFLFYMAAIVFGMTIANSVLEEKQNRVVEILATAIPIRQLLYGKVLGNSMLAFAQIALYAVVGLVTVNVTGVAGDIGWILGASGWFIAFFVAGFAALASVWAVLGSLASRSEDLQSNTGPVITVIMVALFAGLFADGVWLTVASYVPVVSSVAMPIRVLGGDVPVWEPFASLVLTAVVAYLLLRLGERIYQRAVMQSGTALSWRQAMKLEA